MIPRMKSTKIDGVPIRCGPGGTRCACCFPPPGSETRKRMVKQARRVAERIAIAESLELMQDDSETLDNENN